MHPPFDSEAIRVVLLDIEGTTTPIRFVYDVLFPFARARMRAFILANAAREDLRADIEALRLEQRREAGDAPAWSGSTGEAELESAAAYALWLMDRDRKSTALKSLQGKIWESGYLSGELQGQVYGDVPRALRRWRAQGRGVAIYSSGSVLAQKLLFAHSNAGDLSAQIDAYFDTTIGAKREPAAYARIAEALGVKPRGMLFLSDVAAELDAARSAGYATGLCVRGISGGRGSLDEAGRDYPVVKAVVNAVVNDFDAVFP